MQTAREDTLLYIQARLKYVLVQMCSFTLDAGKQCDKVICMVISPWKRYILLECVFVL